MSEIVTILTSGSLSSILALLLWTMFSKRLKASIEHEYNEKLATHKADLKKETEEHLTRLNDKLRKDTEGELARLNAELQRVNAEQAFRFSQVFAKTEETVATTYRELLALHDAGLHFTQTPPSEQESVMKALIPVEKKAKEFLAYYRPNRIYIRKNTAENIDALFSAMNLMDYVGTVMTFDDLRKKFTEIPKLLSALYDDFQEILGFPVQKRKEEI